MQKIFLDENIVLNFPEVLTFIQEDKKIVVPDVVVKSVLNFSGPKRADLYNLLKDAHSKKIIEIITSKDEIDLEITDNEKLSESDRIIIGYAKSLVQQGQNITIASDDKTFAKIAKLNGLSCIDSKELRQQFAKDTIADNDLNKKAEAIDKSDRFSILVNLVITSLFLASVIYLSRRLDSVIQQFANILWISFLVLAGFALFEVREKRRQLYGFIELGFGILTIIIVFYPDIVLANWDVYLKIVAGLYIMVRGLDNLYKGSEKRKLGMLLKRLFRLS